ncbi:YihY/virulence factor BrkB family protein [Chitinophaga barathri]|nr:YihY/virulence factor BrkB family protein [Chitinophaga barathri]
MVTRKGKHLKRWQVFLWSFKDAFTELQANDPLRMAGATAFFTTFALPAILVILLQALRLLFEPRVISRQLFDQLIEIIGPEVTHEVIETLKAFRGIAQNWLIAISGFVFLLFVATTLLKVMTSSVNQLWRIRPIAAGNFRHIMLSRLRGVALILCTGVLFVLGIVADSAQGFIGKYVTLYAPGIEMYYNGVLRYGISVVTVTLWFALVFFLLPDGRPRWKILFTGALVTSILFNIGKLILRWLLTYSNINSIYGTSASIVLLLLFVFYVALIFYYGASFANVWANANDKPIQPLHYAIKYQLTDVEPEDDET